MTRFAATHADIIGFVPKSLAQGGLDPAQFTTAAFDEKIAILDESSAGRSDGGPERSILAFQLVRSVADLPAEADSHWTTPETMAESPYALIGDTEQIVETLLERRERWGLTYVTCWEEDIDALAPVVAKLAGT